jgi:Tfp pilus assembly protein PilV
MTDWREDGFSVMEVVVAATILVIAVVGSAALFANAVQVSGNTRNRVVAQHLATKKMEQIRGTAADPLKFPTIAEGQTVSTEVVEGITFTVKEDVQWVGQGSTQSTCDSPGSNSGQIMQVTETVTWKSMGGTKPVQATTTLAPPVGAFSANSGSIAVKVLNASAQPAESITVRITGPVTDVQQSTTQGCAYFPFLSPGTYTAAVIEGTGVGDQNNLVPSQSTSVAVGQTSSLLFNYDTAATIAVSGWTTSTATPASGLPLSVANTGLQPYGQYSYAPSLTSLSPLFPYTSGFTVFAGSCTDNNPLGKDNTGNPLYPTAAPVPVGVTPGASTAATADLYTLPILVTDVAAVPQPGALMTAVATTTYSSPYTVNCMSGTANAAAPTLGLVTTDAAGNSVTAVPLGHLTVTARAGAKVGTVKVWVMPDGVYAVNAAGAATSVYPGAIPVVVS